MTKDSDFYSKTISTVEFFLLDGRSLTLEVFECSHCNGFVGIDSTFLEQVQEHILCPLCRGFTHVVESSKTQRRVVDLHGGDIGGHCDICGELCKDAGKAGTTCHM